MLRVIFIVMALLVGTVAVAQQGPVCSNRLQMQFALQSGYGEHVVETIEDHVVGVDSAGNEIRLLLELWLSPAGTWTITGYYAPNDRMCMLRFGTGGRPENILDLISATYRA